VNVEKYQLLQSSVGVMTFFKFLVLFCGMLIAGWTTGEAATASDTPADATGTAASETHKSHHRKHHTSKTAESAANSTNSTNATSTGSGEDSTPASHPSKGKTAKSSTSRNTANASTTASTTGGKSHKTRKGHTTATAKGGSTTPETAGKQEKISKTAAASKSGKPASSGTKTAEAAATANGSANTTAARGSASPNRPATGGVTATAGRGRHHHHGSSTMPPAAAAASPSYPAKTMLPPNAVNPATVTPLQSAAAPALSSAASGLSGSAVPQVETGLPVARPGAGTTASLPFAMVRNPAAASTTHFNFTDFPSPRRRTQSYPWKSDIVTTVFWIGEGSAPGVSNTTNHSSAWDINWEHNNGGADGQDDLIGYAPSDHAALLNPFYVALPFNDLAYPEMTSRWLPSGWYRRQHHGEKPVSACQHRWIMIKNLKGRVCFAQWEDVGPLVTDNPEYVFGSERPRARAGLDVSPAVAKYLGIDSTAITSWRFVDDADVQPGMWLRYDEQAILFQALEEQARHGRTTPLQDLSQPVPDGSDDDANQKKINGARG
jgi:hypothetical protein